MRARTIVPLSIVLGLVGVYLWSLGFPLTPVCGGRWTETEYCRQEHHLIVAGFVAGFVVAPILFVVGLIQAVRHWLRH
jgi:hypothetical protein